VGPKGGWNWKWLSPLSRHEIHEVKCQEVPREIEPPAGPEEK